MKIIKEFLKYALLFLAITTVLVIFFVLIASIPRKYIEKNLTAATEHFKKNHMEMTITNKYYPHLWLYPYADQIQFNILYCLDTENPLKSIMELKWYNRFERDGSNLKFVDLVKHDLEPNMQYIRYWHGQSAVIKVFLMFMNIEQMIIMDFVVLIGLLVLLFRQLIKNKNWSIIISFIIGLIMTASWVVPFTLAYTTIYMIMLITSIIAIMVEKKKLGNKKLYNLFFVSGMLTCYFDFLTMELLTILVPIIIILAMRYKENEDFEFKKEFIFTFKACLLWFVSYIFMYIAKWILASIVLDINAMDYVRDQALLRINGQVELYSPVRLMKMALKRNFTTLFPITQIIKSRVNFTVPIIAAISSMVLLIDIKNKKKMKFLLLLVMIGLIPYARYIVLSNHSYLHYFFTFRDQIATVMCVALILTNCLDEKKLFLQVNLNKKTKNKEDNNNIKD